MTAPDAPPPPSDRDAPAELSAARARRQQAERARDGRLPPHDLDAEQAVLGAVLMSPDAVETARVDVEAADFYKPVHQAIFAAVIDVHTSGARADAVTVLDRMLANQAAYAVDGWDRAGLVALLVELQAVVPSVSNVRRYARTVRTHATRRRLIVLAAQIADLGYDLTADEPIDHANQLIEASLDGRETGFDWTGHSWSWTEFVARGDEHRGRELIPGTLRDDTRAVLIASEGAGKMTLLKQIAMAASQGVHPFTTDDMERPVRSLVLDAETPLDTIERQGWLTKKGLDHLLAASGRVWCDDTFRLVTFPRGIDLRGARGKDAIRQLCRDHRPELLVIGPIYRTFERSDDESYEAAFRAASTFLDELQDRFGVAVMLEAHAAGKTSGRDGAQLVPEFGKGWMRWPDLGITLERVHDDDEGSSAPPRFRVGRFRGDRMVDGGWPEFLTHGRGKQMAFVAQWGRGEVMPGRGGGPLPEQF